MVLGGRPPGRVRRSHVIFFIFKDIGFIYVFYFCKIIEEKFNNGRNGITLRSFFLHYNYLLANIIEKLTGKEFKEYISKLINFRNIG